ncbi:membrane-spanning 4-domains subfamily A member 18 [Cricetulus griseus]
MRYHPVKKADHKFYIMIKQETVSAVTVPGNGHVIQPTHTVASGSQEKPLEMATYQASATVHQYNTGNTNLQGPHIVIQNPARMTGLQVQPTVLQYPVRMAGVQPPPGVIQYSPEITSVQVLPGDPQNPLNTVPGPTQTSSNPQWNMSFISFPEFDPKKFINEEVRTLGGIQILIGMFYIVSAVNPQLYWNLPLVGISGHLVWGGLSVNASIGMNIVSSIFSLVGIILIIIDLVIFNSNFSSLTGCLKAIIGGLLPFALLEFIITCVVSHFGCQATCWTHFEDIGIGSGPSHIPDRRLQRRLTDPCTQVIIHSQGTLPESMAAQAPKVISSSGNEKVSQWQGLAPAQPMQKVAQHLAPDGHFEKAQERSDLLQKLGVFHIAIAFANLAFGSYLVSTVKNLHLVVLKCWYPIWGPVSKILCVTANVISFFCALAGLFVMAKDLFLESPFPWPIWRPYPNSTTQMTGKYQRSPAPSSCHSLQVYIQRLELTLLCCTFLEIFLPGPTAITACKTERLHAEMVQDKPLRTSWQQKMKERQERKLTKDFARHLEEEKQRRRQEKKERRAENLKRRLENERKAEIVQVIRNPAKLKKAKKKQLRSIQKRDTLALLQKQPPQRPVAKV